jgi:hypothetical protein
MAFTTEDIICTDKYLGLESADIAYTKTDLIWHRQPAILWRGRVHTLRPAATWITGHSDYPITEEMYTTYSPCCERWFTINKDHEAPNLFALPLGITNCTTESSIHPIYGNTDIMIEVMAQPRQIRNLVYMNFVIGTYPSERAPCYELFKDRPWVTVGTPVPTLEGRRTFLQDLRNHQFVLCPRGNGIDTHRLWETLYMGSIPIVKRHRALAEFTDLPILFIDDWTEVTEPMLLAAAERIAASTWTMEKLRFGYWKNRFT